MAWTRRASLGLSALFYLCLLFTPLATLQTVSAEAEAQEPAAQDPLQESYGTGEHFSKSLGIAA